MFNLTFRTDRHDKLKSIGELQSYSYLDPVHEKVNIKGGKKCNLDFEKTDGLLSKH